MMVGSPIWHPMHDIAHCWFFITHKPNIVRICESIHLCSPVDEACLAKDY